MRPEDLLARLEAGYEYDPMYGQLCNERDQLKAENAKLGELVRSAVRCITDVPDCDSCALGEQVSGVWVCHLIGAAKELGVEVD